MNKLERVFINNWEDKHLKQHICQQADFYFIFCKDWNITFRIQNKTQSGNPKRKEKENHVWLADIPSSIHRSLTLKRPQKTSF